MPEGPNIGSVAMEVIADLKRFRQDVVKQGEAAGTEAGEKAGRTFGQKMATVSKMVMGGVVGGFGGALFAATTTRLAQLERATADFRRETGATAEEATRAGKAINDMAGRNIQSVETIGRTLTAVTTQWGIHGDAAEKAAEQVLKFAQATGIDAETAVNGLDDVMDNWNLTADEGQALMDKLIVSHQRWGGNIEDNIGSLAGLAPAMKAANFKIEDGIKLLGLFGSKGLDANQGAAAFAKALTKVKSPKELQDAITDISNTKDAFDRARKAADLFGARAGAKLANALGGANLDDYKVSLDDAKGATDKAADASLTLADKVKMAFGNITSTVVDTLGPAGPLLQGIAGLSTLLGPAIAGAGKKIGIGLGAAIGAAMGPEIAAKLAAAALPAGVIGIAAAGILLSIPIIFVAVNNLDPKALNTMGGGALAGASVGGFPVAIQPYLDPESAIKTAEDFKAFLTGAGVTYDRLIAQKGLIPKLRASLLGDATGAGGAEGVDPGDRALKAYNDYIKRLYDTVENERRAAERRFLGQSEHNRLSTLDHMVPWVKPLQNIGPKLKMWLRPLPPIVEETVRDTASEMAKLGPSLSDRLRDIPAQMKSVMADVHEALRNPKQWRQSVHSLENQIRTLYRRSVHEHRKGNEANSHILKQGELDTIAIWEHTTGKAWDYSKSISENFHRGIKKGKKPAVDAARDTNADVRTALEHKGGAFAGGLSITTAWVLGLVAGIHQNTGPKSPLAAALEAQRKKLGGSLPETGPLVGSWEGGGSIADAWIGSMVARFAAGRTALAAQLSDVAGTLSGGMAVLGGAMPGMALAATVNGETTVRHIHELAPGSAAQLRAAGFDDRAVAGYILASPEQGNRRWED